MHASKLLCLPSIWLGHIGTTRSVCCEASQNNQLLTIDSFGLSPTIWLRYENGIFWPPLVWRFMGRWEVGNRPIALNTCGLSLTLSELHKQAHSCFGPPSYPNIMTISLPLEEEKDFNNLLSQVAKVKSGWVKNIQNCTTRMVLIINDNGRINKQRKWPT